MKAIIEKLRTQANRFEKEAELASDKFNKGYFEGKAEQNLRLIDAIEAEDHRSAMEALARDS